jgi:PRTRC genetic system protein F
MLFDPRTDGGDLDAASEGRNHASVHTPSGYRPAHGFLAVPDIDSVVQSQMVLRRSTSEELRGLIVRQFEAGYVQAGDVHRPADPGHAFAQGFHAWIRRQCAELKRLRVDFVLMDLDAVTQAIEHQYEHRELELDVPLYIALQMESEFVYEIGERADVIRRAHPGLIGHEQASP